MFRHYFVLNRNVVVLVARNFEDRSSGYYNVNRGHRRWTGQLTRLHVIEYVEAGISVIVDRRCLDQGGIMKGILLPDTVESAVVEDAIARRGSPILPSPNGSYARPKRGPQLLLELGFTRLPNGEQLAVKRSPGPRSRLRPWGKSNRWRTCALSALGLPVTMVPVAGSSWERCQKRTCEDRSSAKCYCCQTGKGNSYTGRPNSRSAAA